MVSSVSLEQEDGPLSGTRTKLCSPLAVDGRAGPVIWPGDIAVLSERYHGLDCECHARLELAHSLVLRVMWDARRAVEDGVDSVAAVRPYHTASPRLGVFLDDIAKLPEKCAGFCNLYCLVETLPRSLDHADRVWVGLGLVSNVVGLVQVSVIALVIQRHVDIQDVSILEDALIGNAMADHFVGRCADRLWEVVVVQRRRV